MLELIKNKDLVTIIYNFLFGFEKGLDVEKHAKGIPMINEINNTHKCKFISKNDHRFSYSETLKEKTKNTHQKSKSLSLSTEDESFQIKSASDHRLVEMMLVEQEARNEKAAVQEQV